MKRAKLYSIGFIVTCGWLATGIAWASPPNGPRGGGLPQCEEELLFCLETAQAFPATGQTRCWDIIGALIDCDGTGQDGDIRAGAPLDYTVTDLTIIDNNTKLEWMKQDDNNGDCGSYPSNLDIHCGFTWEEAFTYVASLNAHNHAGHADWRVPNVRELQSIVDYGEDSPAQPAVSDEFFTECVPGCTVETCSCTAALKYWTSTSYSRNPQSAWYVNLALGDVGFMNKITAGESRVRAVRGPVIDH